MERAWKARSPTDARVRSGGWSPTRAGMPSKPCSERCSASGRSGMRHTRTWSVPRGCRCPRCCARSTGPCWPTSAGRLRRRRSGSMSGSTSSNRVVTWIRVRSAPSWPGCTTSRHQPLGRSTRGTASRSGPRSGTSSSSGCAPSRRPSCPSWPHWSRNWSRWSARSRRPMTSGPATATCGPTTSARRPRAASCCWTGRAPARRG